MQLPPRAFLADFFLEKGQLCSAKVSFLQEKLCNQSLRRYMHGKLCNINNTPKIVKIMHACMSTSFVEHDNDLFLHGTKPSPKIATKLLPSKAIRQKTL